MRCDNCGFENPEDANFCQNCGQSLQRVCPTCSTPNAAIVNFCKNCGTNLREIAQTPSLAIDTTQSPLHKYIPEELLSKITSARASGGMVGERRVVTLLFCDVKGSTAAAEQLDPEDWAEIMNGAFEHLIEPIYRYEGTLARLMGDAILASFGAPITHEDDPQRAVLAGLDILQGIRPYCEQVKRRWNLEINVRVGINTGLVVVGEVGSDLRMEYTALGDAINLASRMEQTAEPGTIQLTENTHRLVAPLFEFEQLGEIDIRGKLDPVPVYRVLGTKTEPGRLRGIEGLEAPLVGRDREMATLREALENLQMGIGKIVCLVGEAGLGKSRLVSELHNFWEAQRNVLYTGSETGPHSHSHTGDITHPTGWIESQAMSYDAARPYAQFQQFLQRAGGITKNDSNETIEQKINHLLAPIPIDERQKALDIFKLVLGTARESIQIQVEGEEFQRELFALMHKVILALTVDEPLILVFDDLHWADTASLELLQHMFPLTGQDAILLLCVFRPDRKAPSWELKTSAERDYAHRYIEIELEPLTEQDSNVLVDNLLVISDLPASVRAQITHLSEGNPFFVEEVVRTLIERALVVQHEDGKHWRADPGVGTSKLGLPDNLRGLLMARIDLLKEDDRHTLQLAAVIGRKFNYQVLKALGDNGSVLPPAETELISSNGSNLDQSLGNLQRAHLIYEVTRVPEHEYAFRHALVQEAAYDTILLKKRREFHLRVGETIEDLYHERVDAQAGLLSHHFYQASDERALKYSITAGESAFRLYANTEAIMHYNRALAIVKRARPESGTGTPLQHLFTRRGRAYELNSQFQKALANYEEMERLALELDDRALELTGLISQAQIRSTANDLFDADEAESLCERALALAHELGDSFAEAKILWNQLNLYRLIDKNLLALETGERSLDILRNLSPEHQLQFEVREQLAYVLNDLYFVGAATQSAEQAMRFLLEARELWQELDNKPMLADNLATTSLGYLMIGEYDNSLAFSDQAYRISKSINNLWGMSYSRFGVGIIYVERGEVDYALKVIEETISLGEQAGFAVVQANSRMIQVLIYGSLGNYDKGFEIADEIFAMATKVNPLWSHVALLLLAELHILKGDTFEAEKLLVKATESDKEMNPIFKYFFLRIKSRIALVHKRFEEGLTILEETQTHINTFGGYFLLEESYFYGKVLLELGHDDEGYKTLITARDRAIEQGSKWSLWKIMFAISKFERQRGNEVAAERALTEARENLAYIADHISDPELRSTFLEQPEVRMANETLKK